MEKFELDTMIKGWFVGNFEPSVIKTSSFEVAVKRYKAGEYEEKHYHKVAQEITVIIQGEVLMNGNLHKSGDIIKLDPNEVTDFYAVTDSINVVVKFPSAINDKFVECD